MAQANQLLPVDFDVRGPHFTRDMRQWSFQVQCEIRELVVGSNAAIANSNALIAQADRILARK